MSTPLAWRPSRLAGRIAMVAAAALIATVLTRSPVLLAFSAPLLGALATGSVRRPPAHVDIRATPSDPRCFETESIDVTVAISAPHCERPDVRLDNAVDVVAEDAQWTGGVLHVRWTLSVPEWGRYAPTLHVTVQTGGGLLTGTATCHPLQLRVFPQTAPLSGDMSPADLPDRIGAHLARRPGEGVEFAGIRPYVPGDQLRTVNWAVTARKGGRLHVTERLAERSADIVALVDTYALESARENALPRDLHKTSGHFRRNLRISRGKAPLLRGPVRVAMTLAVHGAADVVQAALRRGDRSGVIALGGRLRWLGPDIGRRQFYRVVDTVLDAYPVPGDAARSPAGHTEFVPKGVLPHGAAVVAFTPLLDSRIVLALHDVRLRGYPVVVVDVLRELPAGTGRDDLVVRMWRLERKRMHRNFARLGIPVLPWRPDADLAEALAPMARRRLTTARRPG